MKTQLFGALLAMTLMGTATAFAGDSEWRIDCDGNNSNLRLEGSVTDVTRVIVLSGSTKLFDRAGFDVLETRNGIQFGGLAGPGARALVYFDRPGSIQKILCAGGGQVHLSVTDGSWNNVETPECVVLRASAAARKACK